MNKKKKFGFVFLCILLMCCITIVPFLAGDTTSKKTGSITIQYVDKFTGLTIQAVTAENNLPFGDCEREAPQTVGEYKLFGDKTEKVTLTNEEPSQNITFFYYKEGEQIGILQGKYVDISTGKEISSTTTQENADLINIKAPSSNTIEFEGNSYTYVGYKVDYETSTGGTPKAIVTYQYKADEVLKVGTVTVICKDDQGRIISKSVKENVALNVTSIGATQINDFTCTSENPVKISLSKDNPNASVEFTYKYTGTETLPDKTKITLKLKNKLTGEVFDTQVQNVEWGKEVAVPAPSIEGYKICDPDQTILITLCERSTEPDGDIVEVDYTPNIAKVTVHYQDVDGNKIADDDVFDNLEFGSKSVSAKTVAGYTVSGSSVQQVTFDESSYEKEVVFKYTKDVVTTPDDTTYTVVIKYVDENGTEIKQSITQTYKTSTVSIKADAIDGYTLVDDETKSIHMTTANPSATVTFKYKKNVTPSEPVNPPEEVTQGTITINYYLENTQTSVKDTETVKKDFGTQSFTAPEINCYTVVGDKVKSVEISKDNPNGSITFYYKKVESGDNNNPSGDNKPSEDNNKPSGDNNKPSEDNNKPSGDSNNNNNNQTSNTDKFVSGKLVVHFTDSNGNKLLDDDIKTGLSEGTYSYYGKTISGYVLNGSNKITFTLNKNNPSKEITYTYVKNSTSGKGGDLTIVFIDDTTGESLLSSQVYKDINPGTYTYRANSINGYTVYGNDTQSITIGENTKGQITFRYRKNSEGVSENKEESTVNKQGSVVIKYIDKSTGKEISPMKTFDNLEYKSYTYSAEVIEGYEVSGSTEQSVTLSSSKKSMVITFEYNKTNDNKTVTKVDSSKKTSNTVKVNDNNDKTSDKDSSSFNLKGLALKLGIGIVALAIVIIAIVAIKNNKNNDNRIDDDFEL